VDIGGALAEARSEAGLTITQVSERTRIRATIIRDIERDDYSACGGDYYARGHIRAIARVVGTDPVPLIEEYDAARMPPCDPAVPNHAGPDLASSGHVQNGRVENGRVDPDADTNPDLLDGRAMEFGLPGTLWPGLRLSAQRWVAAVRARLADPAQPLGADGTRAPDGSRAADGTRAADGARAANGSAVPPAGPHGITAAEAFRPGLPLDFERRRPRRAWLLGLVVLAVLGVLIYLLVSGGSSPGGAPTKPRAHHSAGAAAHHAGGTAASSSTRSAVVGPLAVAAAAAFGPHGTSQGDDPQGAALAIDGSAGTAWHTDWYTTSKLGGLQSGTGLLLSLGKTDTIASATVVLGRMPGGTIELRAGNTPALADLPVVAQAANPGGALTMRLTVPARARYVLIWLTSLPPDNSGTYEASVSNVRLSGTA
jgi:hypothetical protein